MVSLRNLLSFAARRCVACKSAAGPFTCEAFEVTLLVGRNAGPLRFPHCFAQALEHQVLRVVLRAGLRDELVEARAYAPRLVDRELLFDREMERQMQEGIQLAAFG